MSDIQRETLILSIESGARLLRMDGAKPSSERLSALAYALHNNDELCRQLLDQIAEDAVSDIYYVYLASRNS